MLEMIVRNKKETPGSALQKEKKNWWLTKNCLHFVFRSPVGLCAPFEMLDFFFFARMYALNLFICTADTINNPLWYGLYSAMDRASFYNPLWEDLYPV